MYQLVLPLHIIDAMDAEEVVINHVVIPAPVVQGAQVNVKVIALELVKIYAREDVEKIAQPGVQQLALDVHANAMVVLDAMVVLENAKLYA